MPSTLAISGYRSIRDLVVPLAQLTVVTGANGSGKSSLYRALRLLADNGQGRIVQTLAAEGGLASTLWAGPPTLSRAMKQGTAPVQGQVRRDAVSLKLGFSGDVGGYAIDLGYPVPGKTAFNLDPAIKVETLWTGSAPGRANTVAERRGPSVRIRDEAHIWQQAFTSLAAVDSMLTHAADGRDGLDLLIMRERLKAWRFYDHLRTDREAPSRAPQIGTFTPVLAGDGADLAAALQTIREIGDPEGLAEAVDDAFPGSKVEIEERDGFFSIRLRQPGLLRSLAASEFSDGTLRYLLLLAALTSPRPPEFMVLNEPETSLHPDLAAPLARLIAAASRRCQIVVVTHAAELAHRLLEAPDVLHLELEKDLGETLAQGVERPRWVWPTR
ncbi:AAA family ATPase [Chthonobacter albigriseus]|uniref:AAA family ATPase n=1 Tax=Chthonobacter albigriseus TaxID=1683161 RepID=UPI0015EEF5B9|nr:AAA family ATPase [Chthonobacter albigriseus]